MCAIASNTGLRSHGVLHAGIRWSSGKHRNGVHGNNKPGQIQHSNNNHDHVVTRSSLRGGWPGTSINTDNQCALCSNVTGAALLHVGVHPNVCALASKQASKQKASENERTAIGRAPPWSPDPDATSPPEVLLAPSRPATSAQGAVAISACRNYSRTWTTTTKTQRTATLHARLTSCCHHHRRRLQPAAATTTTSSK